MTQALKEYINAWLQKAEHDIISAQRLIEIEPMILDSACFHCQQAIEKSLKAFMHYKGCEVKKTHDIDYLLEQCLPFDQAFASINPLDLNEYAVIGRYPGDSPMPDIAEAKHFYQLALDVNKMVKDRIVFD